MTVAVNFYAHFVTGGNGATGLTVTVDLDSVAKADGARGAVVTGGSATEGIDGYYHYRYATADLDTYDYICIFKTTGTADQKQIPSLWANYAIGEEARNAAAAPASTALSNATWTDAKAGYLDASINSRSTYAGGAVASVTAGVTLASGEHTNIASDVQTGMTAQGATVARMGFLDVLNGILAAIWGNVTRTLTSISDSAGVTTLLGRNNPLDAAGTRTAVGLATANLDTQLSGISSKTTNLPASPAAISNIPTTTDINTALSTAHGAGAWDAVAAAPTAAAIADAVFDEAMSDHLLPGSTGEKLNASGSLLGIGPVAWQYTLTNLNTGLPVPQAYIWATTDQAGVNIIAEGVTDNMGQITFYLTHGTYYIWRAKAGWKFANPDVESL